MLNRYITLLFIIVESYPSETNFEVTFLCVLAHTVADIFLSAEVSAIPRRLRKSLIV